MVLECCPQHEGQVVITALRKRIPVFFSDFLNHNGFIAIRSVKTIQIERSDFQVLNHHSKLLAFRISNSI